MPPTTPAPVRLPPTIGLLKLYSGTDAFRRVKKTVTRRRDPAPSTGGVQQEPGGVGTQQGSQQGGQQGTQQDTHVRVPHRRSSVAEEVVHLIEHDDTIIRRRGRTTCQDVQRLPPGTRVHIEVNADGVPCNVPECTLLSSYMGMIAKDSTLAPLSFHDWRNPGMEMYKKRQLEDIEARFELPPQARTYVRSNIGLKWRNHKTNLKAEYFNPRLSLREILENVPDGVDPVQWAALVQQWTDPRDKARAEKNTSNAKLQKCPHTLGRKSTVQQTHELELEDRLLIWRASRIHKDGTWTTQDGKDRWDAACAMLAEKGLTPEHGNFVENEAVFTAIMGPEHPGRVRGRGFGIAPSLYFSPTSTASSSSSTPYTGRGKSQLAREMHRDEQIAALGKDVSYMREILEHHFGGPPTNPPEAQFTADDDDDDDDAEAL